MAELTYEVTIDGYWSDDNKLNIPKHSGVYFVYEASYNPSTKRYSLVKLIYIGESGDVNSRIANHEKHYRWKRNIKSGNELFYSTGYVESSKRVRVEAAYIFKHKPPVNTEYTDVFPFDKTRVKSKGKTSFLDTDFTVSRTE